MATRYFSAEEIEQIVMEDHDFEVVDEDSYGSSRWVEHMVSIVRTDDNRLYRISWSSGLTEMQENDYYDGEYPEVFEHTDVQVRSKTSYLAEEEIQKNQKNTVDADINSLMVVSDEKKVGACFSQEKLDEMKRAIELFDSLGALDPVSNFKEHRQAAKKYLQSLLDYSAKTW